MAAGQDINASLHAFMAAHHVGPVGQGEDGEEGAEGAEGAEDSQAMDELSAGNASGM